MIESVTYDIVIVLYNIVIVFVLYDFVVIVLSDLVVIVCSSNSLDQHLNYCVVEHVLNNVYTACILESVT